MLGRFDFFVFLFFSLRRCSAMRNLSIHNHRSIWAKIFVFVKNDLKYKVSFQREFLTLKQNIKSCREEVNFDGTFIGHGQTSTFGILSPIIQSLL